MAKNNKTDEPIFVAPDVKARVVAFGKVTNRNRRLTVKHLLEFAELHDIQYRNAKGLPLPIRGVHVAPAAEPTDGAGGESEDER